MVAALSPPLIVTPEAGPLVHSVANGGLDWVTHACSSTETENGVPAAARAGATSSSSAGLGFGKASGAR